MIVVSDTTALTTLIKAELEFLLPALFGEIKVPGAVEKELLQFHKTLPVWCQVAATPQGPLLESLRAIIDPGEAESITLALD